MDFENTFEVKAPIDEVWRAMLDVERVAPCMPGAEVLEKSGDNAFKVGVKVKLGPVSMQYRGDVEIVERDEKAHRAVMRASAKELRGEGTANAEIATMLAERNGGTQATIQTQLQMRGRAAAMGRGVMQDVASRLVDEFAENLGQVLGGGGVLGGAWLTGGLAAVAEETGWDPAEADYIVGTSAGSLIGSLVASGVPPLFMVAHSAGETFKGVVDTNGRPAASASRSGGAVFKLHRGMPSLGPGSWRLGVAALRNPKVYTPAAAVSAWLPVGLVSNDSIKDVVRRVVAEGWTAHPNTWIVACDYE